MWVFDRPALLLLVLLVPFFFWLRHLRPHRGGRIEFPFTIGGGMRFRPPVTVGITLLRASHVLFWVAAVLLIIAAAGPTRTVRERIFLTRGVDIMIVLDQSPTMAARDVQPGNRLDAARAVIRRFVEQRESDHIGLVGFSREASLRVPATLDHQRLLDTLDTLILMEYGDGTAIGMAVALATLHLQASEAERRIIILLTDGVNNAGEISPEAAADLAAQSGIRLYTIGIGSQQEVEIDFTNPEDGLTYRGTVRESYDPQRLAGLAERAGGRFFEAGSGGTLEAVLNAIGTAETTERRVRVQVRRQPEHEMILLAALILLVADLLIRRVLLAVAP